MTETERKELKKAYVELNEIIKRMSLEEKQKIPTIFIKNLNSKMDKSYKFVIDDKKGILEQNFKVETKALLVELYEKYLALDEEKELWEKYDKICLNLIEEDKKEKYNPNKIFTNKNQKINNVVKNEGINDKLPMEIKDKSIFTKFIQILKKIFHIGC